MRMRFSYLWYVFRIVCIIRIVRILVYTVFMQNPFKRVGAFFSSATQGGGESVVGVDIGSAYLKVVQLRRKTGRAVLETYGSLALGPYAGTDIGRATKLPVQKLSEALRDIMREAHITTKRAAVAIPLSSSLVTIMEMLVLDEKQLPVTVPIEARKYVPVPISEVNLDWWIIPPEPGSEGDKRGGGGAPGSRAGTEVEMGLNPRPTELVGSPDPPSAGLGERGEKGGKEGMGEEGETGEGSAAAAQNGASKKLQILIAAIHNEAMHRFEDVARAAELETSFFEIEVFSAMRAALPADLEPHALLDVGAGASKLYIIDRGLVRVSHSINQGGQDLTLGLSRSLGISVSDAEKLKRVAGLSAGISGKDGGGTLSALLNFIFDETKRVISHFEQQSGHRVKELTLQGGGVNLPGLLDIAQSAFSTPVVRADPFAQTEAPAFLDETLKAAGPEFAVALGVAFRKLQETG